MHYFASPDPSGAAPPNVNDPAPTARLRSSGLPDVDDASRAAEINEDTGAISITIGSINFVLNTHFTRLQTSRHYRMLSFTT